MSQGNCLEVMTMASEKFSAPNASSSDEDEIIVKRKKKKSKLKSSPSSKSNHDGDSSDEEIFGDAGEKSAPPTVKKKSRRIQMDSSSEDEDVLRPPPNNDVTQDIQDNSITDLQKNLSDVDPKLSEGADNHDNSETVQNADDSENSDDESSKSSSDSNNSSDDDAPPLRIFRNKNPTAVNESRKLSENNDVSDEEVVVPDPSEIAEPRSPSKRKSARKSALMDLQSETQRLVRESSVNLPYHRPQPKKLSEFMKRPTLRKKTDENHVKVEADVISSAVKDDLPEIGSQSSQNIRGAEDVDETQAGATCSVENPAVMDAEKSCTQEVVLNRPLTRRERLLQQLGNNLPQLKPKSLQKSPAKFIDLAEDDSKATHSIGVTSLMQRFMKHAKAGRKAPQKNKKVELNIIRKEERPDGSGFELVTDVVKTTVGGETEEKTDLSVLKTAHTSGQRLQLLRQQLAKKMRKKREIERKKREELHKLDNEEIDQSEEEEEDCDWSEEDDEDEEELRKSMDKGKTGENPKCGGNGIIDSSDDSDDGGDEENDTEPFEGSKVGPPSLSGDVSLQREGSVLLFEDSTRSSASTMNKSGCLTPAFDRTCSDDSFYSSMIPLHQPEVSNISASSHFAKPTLPKGEFDDTCFESDSRSLSQPFRLDFEASQSQLLDADGFIRESSITKPVAKVDSDQPVLPPGAEDDNAMTDCNMSQLLGLCSAPFDSPTTQKKTVARLVDKNDSTLGDTQELLGLCSGNFSDSAVQFSSKDDFSSTICNDDVTNDSCYTSESKCQDQSETLPKDDLDLSNIDENSGDLFKPTDVNESFGFNMLSGNQRRGQSSPSPKPVIGQDSDSDDEDDKPITIVRTKKFTRQRIAQEFVDKEAELSGSDLGSGDEDEDAGPDEYEIEAPVEELPEEEEIQRQVNRVHRRQMLEDDQRNIEFLQEALMGGEEIAPRERKFRWKNIDDNMTEDLLKSDDEDSNHCNDPPEVIEDSQWMKERLEREEFLQKNSVDGISEDSQLLNLGHKVVISRQNSIVGLCENSNQPPGGVRSGRLSIDENSSSSWDSLKIQKGSRGSFLSRSQGLLAKLANYQELKNINGARHSDKMLFKAVSPKQNKQTKRKQLSDVKNLTTAGSPKKKKRFICMNEDSNSIFDLM